MSETCVSLPKVGPFDDVTATFDFTSFLVGAQSIGLPVTTLRRLQDRGWTLKLDADRDTSFTPANWLQNLWYGDKTIHLAKKQCFPHCGGSPTNTISCLGTVYHEFTHAYLIEFEDFLENLLTLTRPHYLGVNLKDGTSADEMRVLHESAASFVGDTVSEVVRLMMSFRTAAKGLNEYGMPLQGKGQGERQRGIAIREYNQFLANKVFGTVDEVAVSKTIAPKLREHLDKKILEGLRSRPPSLLAAQGGS
jgi:hypothetical protein